jgi:aminoglycoside phosphotransferase (APT) family kinase protein
MKDHPRDTTAMDITTLPPEIGQALGVAFGDAAVTDLAPLGGGLSAAVLLTFSVEGAGYVVRRGDVTRAPRELECLRIASDLGVAPRLRYADPASGVCIMQRIDGVHLGRGGPDPRRLEKVVATLRRLHCGPAFPPGNGPAEIIGFFQERIARAGDSLPPDLSRVMNEVSPCVARYSAAAPCHRDLNPNNILESKDEIFFVDWETAGAGDPFVDLAQLGVFAFPREGDRAALLPSYLGRSPTDEEAARACLARVIALAVYAAAFAHVRVVAGVPRAPGPALPLTDLMQAIAVTRERTHPGRIADALLLEVQREAASPEYARARARLAP